MPSPTSHDGQKSFISPEPEIIGLDFPVVSQEQINVYNMHGYAAALILGEDTAIDEDRMMPIRQEDHKYMAITLRFLGCHRQRRSPTQTLANFSYIFDLTN